MADKEVHIVLIVNFNLSCSHNTSHSRFVYIPVYPLLYMSRES
jgi:hypothetical protein